MFGFRGKSLSMARIAIALIIIIFTVGNVGAAEVLKSKGKYAGIELYTSPPKPGVKYDEDITSPGTALKKIKAAIDLIYLKSSYSAGKIDFLKKKGRVVMVYDPHLPDPDQASGGMLLAIFLPSYLRDGNTKGSGSKKDFLVVVSRIGILWELDFLASVIVHELVGHGVQHQRGRIDTMRVLDIECEAWLYQERSLQDFGLDKFSKQMGQFRTQLEDRECSEFRRHQAEKYPKAYKLWDETNPDVPRLLANFDKYLGDIRGTKTQAALKYRDSERDKELATVLAGKNAEKIYQAATQFSNGIGVEQDDAKALRWFQRAAELGNKQAQIKIARTYTYGEGVPKDYKKAAKWVALVAKDGADWAQYTYGVFLEQGHLGKPDLVQAAHWYQQAANQGNADAQNNLGTFFRRGKGGFKKNYNEAATLFISAMNGGNSLGTANLARLHRYGQGVKKDPSRAAELYGEAIEKGVTFAFYELGELYRRGLGVKKNFKRARSLFEQGSEKGDKFAKIGLAKLYTRGQGGPKKLDEGLSILRKLGNGPSAKAQLALAKIYWNGRVVPKDLKKAEKWYRKAANRGSRTGMAALAFMYLNGKGVKQNYKEAAGWLQKSANKGHRNAQYLLGTLYDKGNGVSKDPALALSWFKKAASRGHKKAKKRLKK
jgi:TPR repeat protein